MRNGRQRGVSAVLAIAIGGLAACGDDDPPSAETPEEFAVGIADLLCSFGVRCERRTDFIPGDFYCHPAAAAELEERFAEPQPHIRYDPAAGASCLAAVQASIEPCVISDEEACDRILVGTLEAGAPCDDDDQCGPGLYCAGEDRDLICAGTCTAREEVGGSCTRDDACVDLAACGELELCVALGDTGDPCEGPNDCRQPLYCDRLSGVCYEPADAEGRGCDPSVFLGEDCPAGFHCGFADQCTRNPIGARSGPGGSCGEDADCPSLYACVDGSCLADPLLGESCSAEQECLEGICEGGTCVLRAIGESCADGDECADGWCDDTGVCAPFRPLGEACSFGAECGPTARCRGDVCVESAECL